jgi:hypothetical protein
MFSVASGLLSWVVKARQITVVQTINVPTAAAAAMNFSSIFSSVRARDGQGGSASALVGGYESVPRIVYSAANDMSNIFYDLDLSNLLDGNYLFDRALLSYEESPGSVREDPQFLRQKMLLIVDRTPPLAQNLSFSPLFFEDQYFQPVIGALGVTVPIPPTMFGDEGSRLTSRLVVVQVYAVDDARGFAAYSLPVPLNGASIFAQKIVGDAGTSTFAIVVEDEVGNRATGYYSVKVFKAPTPVLQASDSRGTSSSVSFFTGSQAAMTPHAGGGGDWRITVAAAFPEPVTGMTSDDLTVSIAVGSVVLDSERAFRTLVSGREYAWTLRIVSFTHGSELVVSLPGAAASRAVDEVPTAESNRVTIVLDMLPPTLVLGTDSGIPGLALVGAPFASIIPVQYFTDGVHTSAAEITVVGGAVAPNIGLSVSAGAAGRAVINGQAIVLPAARSVPTCFSGAFVPQVLATVILRDLAGNEGAATVCVQLGTLPGLAPRVSVPRETFSFTEGAAPLSFAQGIGLVNFDQSPVYEVIVEIETPDNDERTEYLSAVNPTPASFTLYPYELDASNVGSLGLNGNPIPLADVTRFLESLAYTNTRSDPKPGLRRIRVTFFTRIGSEHAVVAVTSMRIVVSSVNNRPVLNVPPSVTVSETNDVSVTGFLEKFVMPAATISDTDDLNMALARVSILTTNVTNQFASCDKTRERLILASSYAGAGVAARVKGVWDAARCSLTLVPVEDSLLATNSAASVSIPDMQLALRNVRYRNLDGENPVAFATEGWKMNRRIQVSVTDGASNGQVSAPATSVVSNILLVISAVDNPPRLARGEEGYRRLYEEFGPFYDSDVNANARTLTISESIRVPVRKFVGLLDARVLTPVTLTLKMNLTKQMDGIFGGNGPFYDPDSVDPPPIQEITFSCGPGGCPAGVTVASTLNVYNPIEGASELELTVLNPSTTVLGEVEIRMTYGTTIGGPVVSLFVDLRARRCSVMAWADPDTSYPDPSLCDPKQPVLTVMQSASRTVEASSSGYTDKVDALEAKEAALLASTADPMKIYREMDALRQKSKGSFKIVAPSSSLTSNAGQNTVSGSESAIRAQISVAIATTASSDVPTGSESTMDTTLAFKLQPACSSFSEPVHICLFVGTVPTNFQYDIMVSSQLDCSDPSKGYGKPERLLNPTLDRNKGLLCGELTHFSILFVDVSAVPPSPAQPKTLGFSSSCSNHCSGRGLCRGAGKCLCFQGFDGYDCSERTCPNGPSWDLAHPKYKNDPIASIPRAFTECSNRGECNRVSGLCSCYLGFEGSACQRALCPNACSGRGRCMPVGELPKTRAGGYYAANPASVRYGRWEDTSIRACHCDNGYTGPDCSLRICPFGDDPDTVCNRTSSMVQRLKIDFNGLPTAVDPSSSIPGDLYLVSVGPDNRRYTTGTIRNIWTSILDSGHRIRTTLESLPNFAVTKVDVRPELQYLMQRSSSLAFIITFDGELEKGNRPLLACPPGDPEGGYMMGCDTPGCSPRYRQLRAVSGPRDTLPMSPQSQLRQPFPNHPDASATGRWGVIVRLSVSTERDGRQSYSAQSIIYDSIVGESVPQTVIPPSGLRGNITLPYGLVIDFPDRAPSSPATAPVPEVLSGVYEYKWRLAKCSVELVSNASPQLEALECSGRGNCDRRKGQCRCLHGYSGSACSEAPVEV